MSKLNYGFGFRPKEYVADSVLDLIGNTPCVKLSRFMKSVGASGNIIAKLENFNPLGSVSDRTALALIEDAEKREILKEDTVIIEAECGGIGESLAMFGAVKGYKVIIVAADNVSPDKIKAMEALGAEVVLTPSKDGFGGAVNKVREISKQYDNYFIPSQFDNKANPDYHKIDTAREILRDTYGQVDFFVAWSFTGGTVSGVGATLKAYNKNIKIIAVESSDSRLLNGSPVSYENDINVSPGFVPPNVDRTVIDDVFDVLPSESLNAAKSAALTEGLLLSKPGASALFAAARIAVNPNNRNKNIVVLIPDASLYV